MNKLLINFLLKWYGLNEHSDVNIVVLAATNRPDLLDSALTDRPGRFAHTINVPNPANDPEARYEILKFTPTARKWKVTEKIYFAK